MEAKAFKSKHFPQNRMLMVTNFDFSISKSKKKKNGKDFKSPVIMSYLPGF